MIGAIQLDQRGPLKGAGTAALAARDAREIGPDEEFTGGLDVLLLGLKE